MKRLLLILLALCVLGCSDSVTGPDIQVEQEGSTSREVFVISGVRSSEEVFDISGAESHI